MNRLIFAAAIVTLSCTGPKEAVAPDSGVMRDGGPTTPSDAGATSDGGETLDTGPACGNGRIEPGETCDDANAASGDGCSSLCELERGRIELAQANPRAEVDQPILIRGEGFRYATELQLCIVQAEACRFTIGTVQTDAFGVIEADSGEGALFKSIKPWRCLLQSAIQPSRPAPTRSPSNGSFRTWSAKRIMTALRGSDASGTNASPTLRAAAAIARSSNAHRGRSA